MDIAKNFRLTRLFDFYNKMLTDKQRHIFQKYYFDDASLGEIADMLSVSRQAVRDSLLKTENILNEYEEKLGLLKKYEQIEKLLDENKVSKKCKEKIMLVWEGK